MQNDSAKKGGNPFLQRLLTGIILFVVVVAATLASRYTLLALLVAICIGAMIEFYRMARLKGAEPMRGFGIAAALLIIAYAFRVSMLEPLAMLVSIGPMVMIGSALLTAGIAITELFRKKENPLVNIATTLLGVFYIGLPLSLLCFISTWGTTAATGSVPPTGDYSGWTVLSFIFVIWANDIGAYLVGVPLGRHKLFPRISPKKSWEGFFGGLIAGVGIAVLCGWLMGQNVWFWAGLGAVTVVFGVLGDLIESMLKRSAGLKDSGAIMPGHGGWLDRFDALLVATPFVFAYFIIFAFV